ncbi:MAG: hypothetical protein ACLFU0_03935 [Alphaproteobacteria bacterium]
MADKGDAARRASDDADGSVFGHLAGICDGVGCHAGNVADLKAALREAMADDTGVRLAEL